MLQVFVLLYLVFELFSMIVCHLCMDISELLSTEEHFITTRLCVAGYLLLYKQAVIPGSSCCCMHFNNHTDANKFVNDLGPI